MLVMDYFNVVRRLWLVAALLIASLPAPATAQVPRPKPPTTPTKRMGFLLQIYDPAALITVDPKVTLKGSAGGSRAVTAEDKGSRLHADVAAGDRIYSVPVPGFPDPTVTITIASGARTWTIKVTLDPNDIRALVFLRLAKDGKVSKTAREDGKPRAPGAVTPSAPSQRMSMLLQLYDPGKLLKVPPLVTLTGMMGNVKMLQPKDSGKAAHGDSLQGDNVYSAPAPVMPGGAFTITVRSGAQKWVIKVKVNPKDKQPLVVLRLQTRGRIKKEPRAVALTNVKAVAHPGAPGIPKPSTKIAKGRPGFLLQIYDPKRYLKKPPTVTLKGSMGSARKVKPADSGKIQHSDVAKGDRIFSAPAPFFPDGVVNIKIKSERRSWKTKVRIDPEQAQALVFLQLFADGKVKEVPRDVVGKPLPPGHVPWGRRPTTGLGRNLGEVRPVIPTVTRTTRPKSQTGGGANLGSGFVLWALAFVTLGLGMAITLALTGRRPRGAARLAVAAGEAVDPVHLDAGQVAAALTGPLAGHRVVLLGPAPDHGGDAVVSCLEENPLPDELVTAVERLAVSDGPPVALLVTDPEQLDRAGPTDPVLSLGKRVARRFPLWVVDGPEQWSAWGKTAENAEGAEEERGKTAENAEGAEEEQEGTAENAEGAEEEREGDAKGAEGAEEEGA